jgi:DNA polymerase III subunit epsilon
MIVCIVDSETTGFDPKADRVVEIAAVRFHVEHGSVIETYSALIEGTENKAAHINHIAPELLEHGCSGGDVWDMINLMITSSDCVLAHNAAFDKGFIYQYLNSGAEDRPWLCSMRDFEWPTKSDSRKLTELALAHGVFVHSAHRALTDVDILVRLLIRVKEQGHDLLALFEDAMTPKPLLAALVPFERKDEAKAAGFSWNAGAKRWERRMPLTAAKKLPFKTKVLEA